MLPVLGPLQKCNPDIRLAVLKPGPADFLNQAALDTEQNAQVTCASVVPCFRMRKKHSEMLAFTIGIAHGTRLKIIVMVLCTSLAVTLKEG